MIKNRICGGRLSIKTAAILVGVMSGIGGTILTMVYAVSISGYLRNPKDTLPLYIKIIRGVFCGLFVLLIIFSCILLYGIDNKRPRFFWPWIILIVVLFIFNIVSLVVEIAFGNELENSKGYSFIKELVIATIFNVLCIFKIFIVQLEYKRMKSEF